MRIAVDAVGGDHGAEVVVAGAIAGARRQGIGLILTGPEAEIRAAVAGADAAGVDLVVRDAPETIGMAEAPAQAVRRKPRSSIAVALEAVAAGEAAAMVSAGNSGAAMAAALMVLGRIPGIDRPAIAAPFPTRRGRTLVLDLGAVTDPKPHHLVQFARMGVVYAEKVLEIARPTVGLLSNGEEATKGNLLVQEAYQLLAAAEGLDFRGNVEGKDIPRGVVDVVVTDGFTGNIALKVAEGVASFVGETIRREIEAAGWRKIGAALLRPAFASARTKLDYAETGGATLLGVAGVVVIAHGRSDAATVGNAIGVAARAAGGDVAGAIAESLEAPANRGAVA